MLKPIERDYSGESGALRAAADRLLEIYDELILIISEIDFLEAEAVNLKTINEKLRQQPVPVIGSAS